MLTKDRRRGERRWRSHCKFLRRVKKDWNDHGWNWNPLHFGRIQYGLTKEGAVSFWAGTDLCTCFYDPGMAGWARFKDTPHRSCSVWDCKTRHSTHGMESRPIQEWRAMLEAEGDAVEDFSIRKRRDGIRRVRVQCRCGFLMGFRWIRFREASWKARMSDRDCESCRRRLENKDVIWFNGKPMEFESRPA